MSEIILKCKKNGAGVRSANKFIHNLEYKEDINKRGNVFVGAASLGN
jgi:hypothetical protein